MNSFVCALVVALIIPVAIAADSPEYYGIYSDEHPNAELEFDENIKLYLWEETGRLAEKSDNRGYVKRYMSFQYSNQKSWFGFGYTSYPEKNLVNLSRFKSGYLSISLKASGELSSNFKVGIKSGQTRDGEAWLEVSRYGFVNDGEWHTLNIPIADFVKSNSFLELTQISQFLMIVGKGNIPNDMMFSFDEIFWTSK